MGTLHGPTSQVSACAVADGQITCAATQSCISRVHAVCCSQPSCTFSTLSYLSLPLWLKSLLCLYSTVMYEPRWPWAYVDSLLMDCVCVCVYIVGEKEDPLARGLYIPCPDHYKNYCVHGECQFPSILAQPSCRYTHTHTHTHTGWLYWMFVRTKDR